MGEELLSEYISNSSETELKYLKDTIQNVSDKIISLKKNVVERMDMKYMQYLPIEQNEEILLESSDLVQDIKQLQSRLDTQTKRDVEDLTEELKNLKESHIESSTILEICSKLCKVDEELYKSKESSKLKNNHLTAKHLSTASKILNEECKDLQFLDIYVALSQSVSIKADQHCRESLANWRDCVIWTETLKLKLENEETQSSLCISTNVDLLEDLIWTLELYDISDREVAMFGDNFLKVFLEPTIKIHTYITVKESLSSKDLTIVCSPNLAKPVCKQVLHNLTILFQFLEDTMNFNMNDGPFIGRLGKCIADDFLNLLNDECLTEAIPDKRKDLKNYSPLSAITDFQALLITIGFIPESNKFLEAYVGNVETLFLEKTIEKYMSMARSLMKKDLHELCEVEKEPFTTKKTTPTNNSIKKERKDSTVSTFHEPLLTDMDQICPNFLKIPKYSISKSVEELVAMLEKIILEGLEPDNKFNAEYLHLAKDILEIYPELVLLYHKRVLQDIPQNSALLYNNLTFLALAVVELDYIKNSFANDSNGSIIYGCCLTDLVLPFRKEAWQVLTQQKQRQQKILLKLVKESGLSALSEYDELPENTEKSIKACIWQLVHLKAVWKDVLPLDVYSEVIGELCSAVIDEITNRIVATSDIRADIATSLVRVLTQILTDVPVLFADPKEVYQHVKSWPKLNELILVLGASLTEVGERWADGKGPLALEFTALQVRQMVKALFQVSDRRAAILAKIK